MHQANEVPSQEISKYQKAIAALGKKVYSQERPVVFIFEGHRTSNIGEAIRRLTEVLDPRGYEVHAIGQAHGEDALHHYLWRFWHIVPEAGRIAIFDHSWYGRVLEDRVERNCSEAAWKRAYREINQFEEQLVTFGTIPIKFWFQIDREVQLQRLEALQTSADQLWRASDNGWREQENWFLYQGAIDDMLLRTNTTYAPWNIINASSAEYGQLKTLQITVETLRQKIDLKPFTDKASSRRIKGKSSKTKKVK